MISVIISSGNQNLLAAVNQNIAETIGVPYELITFNNTGGSKGICEVYNEGIQKARYELLCFMHEDIILHTLNWGQVVNGIFTGHPSLGLLGVAGSYYKPLTPSGWLGKGIDTECSNLMQAYKFKTQETHLHHKKPYDTQLAEVAAVDGVWFCVPKAVAAQYKFDAATFKGFHAYDVDFSIAVGLKYQIAVTYDVLLTHLSEGKFNEVWLNEILKLHNKWKAVLPVNKGKLQSEQQLYIEKVTFKYFLIQLTELKQPLSIGFKVLWKNLFLRKLGAGMFFKLNFYTLKCCIGMRPKL